MVSELLLTDIIYPALVGGIGGIARSSLGVLKSYAAKPKRKFSTHYYLITVFIAAIIGIFIGIIFGPNYKVAGLAGYAGTDVLEIAFRRFYR
jgi:di/tricarboxylate transporter